MFAVFGITNFLLLPFVAATGMTLIGASTVLAPSVLLLLPFMVAGV